MDSSAIIIGAGIAGLTCGAALADAGLRVTVLEAGREPGGRARSWTDSDTGDAVDIGPHILLSEYHNMLQLLGQLGTLDRITWQGREFLTLIDAPHPVTIRMHPLPAPAHFLPSMLRVPQLSWRDLASNRRVIWQALRLREDQVLHLDAVPAETHLRRQGVSEHFIDWFWRSACMAIMNVPLERCSAGALLDFFRYMIGKSGYRVGFAAVPLEELFAPGAMARIERAGGRILTDTPAAAVLQRRGSAVGVALSDGRHLETAHCIAALPPQDLRPLLPREWLDYHPFIDLADIQPSPYVSTYLWYDRKLTERRFWTKVWSPETVNYDFYDLSNIRQGWSERPSVLACNSVYSERTGALTDAEIVAASVREAAQALPGARNATLLHSRVHRIPMSIPLPEPGSERRRPPTTTPIPGLLLAGDWIRTGLPASMESAVRAGYLAAEQVLRREGRPRQLAHPPPRTDLLARLLGG